MKDIQYDDKEFYNIINPILEVSNFNDTKGIIHHGITRYEHCMRVAYYSYKIVKALHLDYVETTEAALLHDFFFDEVADMNEIKKWREHPKYAVINAQKYIDLSDKQIDIIKNHMFPITFTPPRYLESWIVDIVDDFVAIYEKAMTTSHELSASCTFLFILLTNYLKMH